MKFKAIFVGANVRERKDGSGKLLIFNYVISEKEAIQNTDNSYGLNCLTAFFDDITLLNKLKSIPVLSQIEVEVVNTPNPRNPMRMVSRITKINDIEC